MAVTVPRTAAVPLGLCCKEAPSSSSACRLTPSREGRQHGRPAEDLPALGGPGERGLRSMGPSHHGSWASRTHRSPRAHRQPPGVSGPHCHPRGTPPRAGPVLTGPRARAHRRPNKVACPGCPWRGFLPGATLGGGVTSFELLAPQPVVEELQTQRWPPRPAASLARADLI